MATPVQATESYGTPITATIGNSSGTRALSAVPDIVVPDGTTTTQDIEGSMTVVVRESARAGTSDWVLVASVAPSPATPVGNEQVSVEKRSASRSGSGGTVQAGTGRGDLAEPITLLRVTGQEPDRLYTGTHVSRSRFAWPAAIASQTGTVTLTLVQ